MGHGEKALVHHAQGPETNVDAVQKQNRSMNMINGCGGNEMLPLEDVNVPSGWLNSCLKKVFLSKVSIVYFVLNRLIFSCRSFYL